MTEHHNIIVIGAGQGGLGVSYYLTKAGVEHLVLERSGIASSWKDNRWDTFCLVTPNWTLNLPGKPYSGLDPDGFMKRDEFVQYFTEWAESFDAPVRKNINVTRVIPKENGFLLKTSAGDLTSDIIVVARLHTKTLKYLVYQKNYLMKLCKFTQSSIKMHHK